MKYLKLFLLTFLFFILSSGCTGGLEDNGTKQNPTTFSDKIEIHYIDVGQGDATLIKTGDHAMLIDAGENHKGTAVQAYLNTQNINHLDYMIGTHPDSDHIGGMDVILYKFPCDTVIMPDIAPDTKTYDDVVQTLKRKNLKVTLPVAGTRYSLGDAVFTIIAPNQDYGEDTNNWSVGILLQYGETRFLFTGDAEKKAEEDMLQNGISLKADVYKAAHHGSKTGSSEEFIDEVDPEYAVISCGEENEYGHPSAKTLNLFRSRDMKVFRTDFQGTIVASSDGKEITWNMSPEESWISGEPKGSADKQASGSKTSEKEKTTQSISQLVLNTNTMKYHKPDCRYVKKMNGSNRKDTNRSEKELKKEGYEPCKTCNP